MYRVFVYGTLTDPDRAAIVGSEVEFGSDATLDGLHRVEGSYPTLAPGRSVDGRILRTPDIDAFDAYEGVEGGLYVRVPIPSANEAGAIQCYIGDPNCLGAETTWPGTGPFGERVRSYLDDHSVVVRRDD